MSLFFFRPTEWPSETGRQLAFIVAFPFFSYIFFLSFLFSQTFCLDFLWQRAIHCKKKKELAKSVRSSYLNQCFQKPPKNVLLVSREILLGKTRIFHNWKMVVIRELLENELLFEIGKHDHGLMVKTTLILPKLVDAALFLYSSNSLTRQSPPTSQFDSFLLSVVLSGYKFERKVLWNQFSALFYKASV